MLSLLHTRRAWLSAIAVMLVLAGMGFGVWAWTTRDGGDDQGAPQVEREPTSTPATEATLPAPPSPTSVPTIEPPADRTPAAVGWEPVGITALDATYALRPDRASTAGIKPDTTFVLESRAADLDQTTLARRFRVEPAVEFTASGGPSALTVRPNTPLRESQAYRFTLLDPDGASVVRTWAFQTEGPLRAASPAAHASTTARDSPCRPLPSIAWDNTPRRETCRFEVKVHTNRGR